MEITVYISQNWNPTRHKCTFEVTENSIESKREHDKWEVVNRLHDTWSYAQPEVAYSIVTLKLWGYAVTRFVEVLNYKPEGLWVDSWWGH